MKDLASGVLVGNISNSATTMTVKVGSGDSLTTAAVWPSVPFYATIMPANPIAGASNSLDSEIVKVTNLTGGNGQVTMTMSRGQRGTSTKEFSDGAIVTNGIYSDDAVFIDDLVSEVEEPTPWIESTDIKPNAVKSDNIDWTTMCKEYTMTNTSKLKGGEVKVYEIGKILIVQATVQTNVCQYQDILATLDKNYDIPKALLDGGGYLSVAVRDGKLSLIANGAIAQDAWRSTNVATIIR